MTSVGLAMTSNAAERFCDELFGRRSCTELMDRDPLVFDVSASLRQMSGGGAAMPASRASSGWHRRTGPDVPWRWCAARS